jgi:outer membrane protein TolC
VASGALFVYRNLSFYLGLSSLLLLSTTAYSASISDSVTSAVAKHPTVAAGKASRDAARNTLQERKSDYFPTLSLQARGGGVRANDDTTRAATGGDAESWLGEGTATFTQPLFAGFSTVNRVDGAKERLKATEQVWSSTAEDIALTAARAHLNLMRTKELLSMADANIGAISTRRDNIRAMVNEGAADESEALQANEILMNIKTTRLGFEEAYRQAEVDYIEVVGAPPAEGLELGATLWDQAIPASAEDAVASATKSNPKLLSANHLAAALNEEAAAETGALWPKLDAEMSYTEKDQDDNLGGELTNAQAMLKMSWNFSTGGAQLARIGRGKNQAAEAKARREAALRDMEHAVRQKFISTQMVDQQYTLFAQRAEDNKKIVDNFLSQYEGGKQTNLQLISAYAKSLESQTASTDAYYRRILSRFELLNAMGRLRSTFAAVEKATEKAAQAK